MRDDANGFASGIHEGIRVPPWRLPLRNLAIVLVIGAVLGRIGPIGTFEDLGTGARYAYWVTLTLLLWAQMAAAFAVLRRVPTMARAPRPVVAVPAALLGALPATFQVAWAESLLRVGGVLTPWSMVETYGDVCLFALAIALPLSLIRGLELLPDGAVAPTTGVAEEAGPGSGRVVAGEAEPGASGRPPSPFLARLPARLGTRILAVEAEDHYLRVHTDAGSDLVLCRMADAVAELEVLDGMRVHRSWWVARDAVTASAREGARDVLILTNGLKVPVSRSYGVAAREAGLLT